MVSPDLSETEIDSIWGRVQRSIDVSKVKNKTHLYKQIKQNPNTRFWNRELNNLIWDFETLKPIFKEDISKVIKRRIKIQGSEKQTAYTRLRGRKWIDGEIKFAQKMKKDGLSVLQIAINLKRTKSSVYTKLHRLKGG